MARIVDELVTKYTLDDQYSAKAKQVAGATQGLGGVLGSMGSMFGSLGAVGGPVTVAALAVAAFGAAAVATGKAAIEAFIPFDTIERGFIGILGSGKAAGQMMEYLEARALKSAFGLQDLAGAASSLGMASLDVGRFLPLVERLALASGNVSGSGLMDASSVLRRLRGGQVAEALGPEGLGRFGINRQDLMAQGARFNGQGQFVGGIDQALAVVEATVNKRLGNVADEVGKGAAATFSNVADSWDKAMRDVGRTLYTELGPAIIEVTRGFNAFLSSGALNDLIRMGGALGAFDWHAVATGLLAFAFALKTVTAIYGLTMAGFVKGGVIGAVVALFQGVPSLMEDMRQGLIGALVRMSLNGLGDPSAPGIPGANDPIASVAENTRETADNTRKMLDHSRHIFGGGDLGRMGVTPIEIGSRRGSTRIQIDVNGAEGPFREFVELVSMQVARQIMAQRA